MKKLLIASTALYMLTCLPAYAQIVIQPTFIAPQPVMVAPQPVLVAQQPVLVSPAPVYMVQPGYPVHIDHHHHYDYRYWAEHNEHRHHD